MKSEYDPTFFMLFDDYPTFKHYRTDVRNPFRST